MKYYPIALQLNGQNVSVIGGGPVAERKILSLVKSGADIKVVSPHLTSKLAWLVTKGAISWRKGSAIKADFKSAKIVIAATSNKRVNNQVNSWARELGAWVNVVDNSTLSNFISPAIFRKGKAFIAVHTDGKDPELSRDLKNFIKEQCDDFLSYRDRS